MLLRRFGRHVLPPLFNQVGFLQGICRPQSSGRTSSLGSGATGIRQGVVDQGVLIGRDIGLPRAHIQLLY